MRNHPEIKGFLLCAALCVSLLLAPLAQAAGRTNDRGDDDARVRTSESISVRIATPGPVNLHRLLRNYLRLQFFRAIQESPDGSGYNPAGLSDDPDPTSDRGEDDPDDPDGDSGSGNDNGPESEDNDVGNRGLH